MSFASMHNDYLDPDRHLHEEEPPCEKCKWDTGEGCILTKECRYEEKVDGTQAKIISVCDSIKSMLLEKNRKYGDSAISPKRVFSKSSPVEQIKVRIDDKLSRIMSSQTDEDEDVVTDLIGYLILLKVAKD